MNHADPNVAELPAGARFLGRERLRRSGHLITFGDARFPEDHPEILELRLRAHQHRGHLTGFTDGDLASPFDSYSRHLVCRIERRIIGYVRLIHVDGDPAKSQYIAWGKHQVPDWLWQAGFIEAGAGAMEPDYQGSGLFLLLMQHAVRVARQLGHNYILGACEDDLLGMYQAMGFSHLEFRDVEPRAGWKFRSHLIVMDMDGLLRAPPQGKWIAVMAESISSVEASGPLRATMAK